MIIGLDFDNTIICYDKVFQQEAVRQNFISSLTPYSKIEIRNELRKKGQEDLWTELQGHVYGPKINLAEIFKGVCSFISNATESGHQCVIISHKTRYPYKGPMYDLHKSAMSWIKKNLIDKNGNALIANQNIFFHKTKAAKITDIEAKGCDFFLDDLPEILLDKNFPRKTNGIIFDPHNSYSDQKLKKVSTWMQFQSLIGL